MASRGQFILATLALATLGACTGPNEVRMADPRTGVVAICRIEPSSTPKPDTILAAVTQTDPCVQELAYYGFQDEEATPARFARPVWDINHVLSYGQSLSCGWDGWPVLTRQPRHDNLMLGESVHAANPDGPHWRPVGEPGFRPLIATIQPAASLQVLQDGMPEPGACALGETILESALTEWRARSLSSKQASIGHHRLLASSCGVGGQSIEALSPQAQPNLFQRLRDCCDIARRTAEAGNQTYGVVAVAFLQGEANTLAGQDPISMASDYKRNFIDLCKAIRSDTRQETVPIIFTYQTGGAYATDNNTIPQAQLELALQLEGVVMVSPVYHLPHTPSGHLDANGYRWLGAQFGKIMHAVIDQNREFRPTHPLRAICEANILTLEFHVPVPPLRWGDPYPGNPTATVSNKGFTVSDRTGPIPIASVDIDSDCTLRIVLARSPVDLCKVSYASVVTGGRGCLHDGDSSLSVGKYTIDETVSTGFQAPAPNLENRHYTLQNWCVAFSDLQSMTSQNEISDQSLVPGRAMPLFRCSLSKIRNELNPNRARPSNRAAFPKAQLSNSNEVANRDVLAPANLPQGVPQLGFKANARPAAATHNVSVQQTTLAQHGPHSSMGATLKSYHEQNV
eukprot:gene2006-2044_t